MAVITGIDVFREHFAEFKDQYVLIGGVACFLSLEEAGLPFRATQDFDIVLCSEILTPEFGKKFWAFVQKGGYKNRAKAAGEKQFYRFTEPEDKQYPKMLELFSREPTDFEIHVDSELTPIPFSEEIYSLSAILLDTDYYECIQNGKVTIGGINVLDPVYLVAFKAKAWLDLKARKEAGQQVDSRDIKKHKYDVFRMTQLLTIGDSRDIPDSIKNDIRRFFDGIRNDGEIDFKGLGFPGMSIDSAEHDLSIIFNIIRNPLVNLLV